MNEKYLLLFSSIRSIRRYRRDACLESLHQSDARLTEGRHATSDDAPTIGEQLEIVDEQEPAASCLMWEILIHMS